MPVSKAAKSVELDIKGLTFSSFDIYIKSKSPLIFNCMSAKARHSLLMPSGRMTAADKAANMKHNPLAEFRDSMEKRGPKEDGPTRVIMPAPAFKGCMATAALDLPGAVTKTKINRLVWVEGEKIDIYGIPVLKMDVVRMADISKTPDIRTRACMREWAAKITVNFVTPHLNENSVGVLLQSGGLICGVGDFRQEKGKGSHGQYLICGHDDEDYQRIIATGGRQDQDEAIAHPEFYDDRTKEDYEWYEAEILARQNAPVVPKTKKKAAVIEDAPAGSA